MKMKDPCYVWERSEPYPLKTQKQIIMEYKQHLINEHKVELLSVALAVKEVLLLNRREEP